jgi:hypothetical protein
VLSDSPPAIAGASAERPAIDPPIQRLVHVALLGATPWIQLALNPSLFMTPGGNRYIDPWLYTGMFLSLPDFVKRFPETYYGARLPWLVPGYLAHRSFPPLVANYVLHLTFFYILLAATYGLVAASHRRAAMLAATTVAWSPVILAALSWDYVDGAGIVFIMVTLLALEKSAPHRTGSWMWSLLAGAMIVCLPCSNLFLLVTWPLFALFLVLRRGSEGMRGVARITGIAVVGGAITFLAFAAIRVTLGGHWFFVAPQLRFGQTLTSAPNRWQLSGYSWVRHAPWLVLPAVATAGSALHCVRWSRTEPGLTRTMQVVTLAAIALWTVVQFSGTPVYQISYYSSYLAPLALLALTLPCVGVLARLRGRTVLLLELATFGLFALGHAALTSDVAGFWNRVQVGINKGMPALTPLVGIAFDASVVFGLAAGLMMILVTQRLRPEALRWAGSAVCLAIIAGAAPPDLPSRTDRIARDYFKVVVAAHRFIDSQIQGRVLRLWSSDPRGNNRPIIGTASSYLWTFSLVNYELPRLDAQEATVLAKGRRLVLLVPAAQDAEAARAPLRQFGYELDVVGARNFGAGDLAMSVVVADLK